MLSEVNQVSVPVPKIQFLCLDCLKQNRLCNEDRCWVIKPTPKDQCTRFTKQEWDLIRLRLNNKNKGSKNVLDLFLGHCLRGARVSEPHIKSLMDELQKHSYEWFYKVMHLLLQSNRLASEIVVP